MTPRPFSLRSIVPGSTFLRRTCALAIVGALVSACAPAAPATADDESALEAPPRATITHPPMQPLAFLVGRFAGTGTIDLGPGGSHAFVETEVVEAKLGGVLLALEGRGTAEDDAAEVVHHAFGVIFHDGHGYRMRSFTKEGRTIESDVVVGERTLAWGYDAGSQRVRFTIEITPEGRWIESGSMSADGATWRPFFAMDLARADEKRM